MARERLTKLTMERSAIAMIDLGGEALRRLKGGEVLDFI